MSYQTIHGAQTIDPDNSAGSSEKADPDRRRYWKRRKMPGHLFKDNERR
jgi:hypothetical protein